MDSVRVMLVVIMLGCVANELFKIKIKKGE